MDGELDAFEFDLNNELEWEGIAEVLMESKDDDNCIRINPISSKYTVSENKMFTSDSDAVTSLNYVGSAGTSRRSVEFEDFLRSPEAKELFEGSPFGYNTGQMSLTRFVKLSCFIFPSSIIDFNFFSVMVQIAQPGRPNEKMSILLHPSLTMKMLMELRL